jgi:uncharacterized membrane protein (UPF0127 family)
MTHPRIAIATFAALMLCGCATAAGDGDAWVELKGKRFTVEIADDPAEREQGLMFRDELATGHGMLFLHDAEEPQAYWMKNTRIPLDILYFDRARKLVSVAHAPPCSAEDRCPAFPSQGPAIYVLELNAGAAEELGVKAGDELKFGPGVPPKK